MNIGRNRTALAGGRAVIGTLALVAVGAQLLAASHEPTFALPNFFGYFTILSNTLVALVLVYVATQSGHPSHRLDVVRGAGALAFSLVGPIFWVLLAHLESNVLAWVNVVVHYIMPVAVVTDWVIDPPLSRITVRDIVWWLAYPLSYVVYTLVRGSIVHWYPYPFLDVDTAGWAMVAAYVAAIFVVTLIFAAIVATTGNALRVRYDGSLGAVFRKPG